METDLQTTTIKNIKPFWWVMIIACATLVGVTIFNTWYNHKLNTRINELSVTISALESAMASTTSDLRNAITDTHSSLSAALSQEQQNVGAIKQELGTYKGQVSTISSTVSTLQKLSETDKQLLQKYSKVFFLNEHYAPPSLVQVLNEYKYSELRFPQVLPQVSPHLEAMLGNAKDDGIEIYVFSAFRSFNEQDVLKSSYKVTYGAGTANQFSADQGYSEHQLGTTVDLITSGLGGVLDEKFAGTPAFTWLTKNAHKYGFVLSYPKNNPYYIFEPWHWRFVGVKLASDLNNQGKYFYDMEQRDLDEYLVNIFD